MIQELLSHYKANYGRLQSLQKVIESKDYSIDEGIRNLLKLLCSWEEVRSRLLANDGHYLYKAGCLQERGLLFGVDDRGSLLFADGGEELLMTNRKYPDTRNAICFLEESKKVPTGYEMFPYFEDWSYCEGYDRTSPEMEMFEAFTGRPFPFVNSNYQVYPNPDPRSSWLESGENPLQARCSFYNPYVCMVHRVNPAERHPKRGVRRLLRVKN